MTLAEFLATANVDDAAALTEAQAHTETRGKLIHRDSMNSFLAQAGIYAAMKKIAAEDGHPWQDAVSAFMDSNEFNFMQTGTTGPAQIAMLDGMIAGGITQGVGARSVDVSGALAAIKPTVIARANETINPFASTTLEQVKAIRHPATWQPVTIASGNDKVVLTEGDAILSASNKSAFRFTTDAPCKIRIKAKKADETVFTDQPQYSFDIKEAGAHTFQRTLGLSGYRHFQFDYLGAYDGAVTSVVVEGVV